MIKNGSSIPLSSAIGGLPQMSHVLLDWFLPIKFYRVSKTIENFRTVETETEINTSGVVQTMGNASIVLKPEGQRTWNWYTLHCLPDIILNNDEIVFYDSIRYRVKGYSNYSKYGFIEYELIEDFE